MLHSGRGRPARLLALALAAMVATAGCSLIGPSGPTPTPIPPPAFGPDDLLPDLQMTKLRDLFTARPEGSDTLLLRFTAEFVNTGAGTFEVVGERPGGMGAPTMSTLQVVYNKDGSATRFPTSAVMGYQADDHTHWHIWDFERYEIVDLATNETVTKSLKEGFCLWDTNKFDLTLPGAPEAAQYLDCAEKSDLSVVMGVSVGWGDVYDWSMSTQYIDITGVKPGKYRLLATTDPSGWMAESNEDNNTTWVDMEFSEGDEGVLNVTVTDYGPFAPVPEGAATPVPGATTMPMPGSSATPVP